MSATDTIVYKNHLLLRNGSESLLRQTGVGKDIILRGHPLYAVPHNEESTKVLHNTGYTGVPAPVLVPGRFDWPGRYTPMAHQRAVTAFYTLNKRCFNLSGMGTGKTAASVWAAEYMIRQGMIKKVLVVAPLSCLRRVWEDEILNLTPGRECAVLHGGKPKRAKEMARNVTWNVINHDGIKFELDALMKQSYDLVIVDEFTAFKTHNSARSKALKKLTANTRLWMLSGTPTPKSPEDAYFPCKLVNPSMPLTLTRFRDATMFPLGNYGFAPRANAKDVVRGLMQPAILIKKEDVLDLPPLTRVRREVELSAPQKAALKQIKNERVLQTRDSAGLVGTTSAVNAAVLMGKVLQIAQGAIKQDDGTVAYLKADARLRAVSDLIEESQGKAIVYAPYRASLEMLEAYLGSLYRVARVDGSTSSGMRNEAFSAFQNSDELDVLVAHEKVASHGLTLTAADLTTWYGPTTSNESYMQANARMNRPGQTKPMTIAQVGACSQEWSVYRTLEGQGNMQQTLLDLYETY